MGAALSLRRGAGLGFGRNAVPLQTHEEGLREKLLSHMRSNSETNLLDLHESSPVHAQLLHATSMNAVAMSAAALTGSPSGYVGRANRSLDGESVENVGADNGAGGKARKAQSSASGDSFPPRSMDWLNKLKLDPEEKAAFAQVFDDVDILRCDVNTLP